MLKKFTDHDSKKLISFNTWALNATLPLRSADPRLQCSITISVLLFYRYKLFYLDMVPKRYSSTRYAFWYRTRKRDTRTNSLKITSNDHSMDRCSGETPLLIRRHSKKQLWSQKTWPVCWLILFMLIFI